MYFDIYGFAKREIIKCLLKFSILEILTGSTGSEVSFSKSLIYLALNVLPLLWVFTNLSLHKIRNATGIIIVIVNLFKSSKMLPLRV